ncbi:hypothetical protein NAG18_19390 [Pseudomonas aeruginosa]|nr:hypothetical protein [Pseudomonas aeruginosa]MCR3787325.1 hypothetical protein [Pseudomonas aeruginosa]TEG11561.1 hypothetical protein IPC1343_23130 [Pseudomonas aeruginosa]
MSGERTGYAGFFRKEQAGSSGTNQRIDWQESFQARILINLRVVLRDAGLPIGPAWQGIASEEWLPKNHRKAVTLMVEPFSSVGPVVGVKPD